MFSILGLLFAGAFLFGYTLLLELGVSIPGLWPCYSILSRIAQNKTAWAGATTVNCYNSRNRSHVWNLRLTSTKFYEEMKKFEREEQEKLEKSKGKSVKANLFY